MENTAHLTSLTSSNVNASGLLAQSPRSRIRVEQVHCLGASRRLFIVHYWSCTHHCIAQELGHGIHH